MISSLKIFYSTIGRKLLMALTGLFLLLFLAEHLYGNLLLYKMDGGKAFEEYSAFLVGNIIIRTIEFALFGSILLHAIDGLYLTISNKKARPVGYEVSKQAKNSTWFSRNMGLTGSVILVFLIVHLREFFFSHRFGTPENSMAVDVAIAFSHAWYAALYIVSMVLLGSHLNHGFQSAFQTLGVNNHKYSRVIKTAGTAVALIMTVGFASFPIIFYFDLFGISTNIMATVVH